MYDIYIESGESVYPSDEYYFSPYVCYPEYPFSKNTVSKVQNKIYDMVRNCLAGLGLDADNFGNQKWNPFNELISQGDTVLIKPNWVMHKNSNKRLTDNENDLDCIVTNPSIVRAVCDYCIIALKGTGRLIIGDAPMQGCDLKRLLEKVGYNKLIDFYRSNGIEITFCDFREYQSIFDANKVIIKREYTNQKYIDVELGEKSMHYSEKIKKLYQVSDYEASLTNKYHHGLHHKYSINQNVLQADVLINICKPKCHRLSGMTAALKNLVGITYSKASLPHRTMGSKEEGGDEYLKKSYIKKLISLVLAKKIKYENEKKLKRALLMRYTYGILYYYVKFIKRDKFLIGSWYGNDTIWRTILDLNYIMKYADKGGKLSQKEQRKIFNVADMVIAGQGNGPVSPYPKSLGLIIAGENSVSIDRIICKIMGFDYLKVPGLKEASNNKKFMTKDFEDYTVGSNSHKYCGAACKIKFPREWNFRPCDSWKGHIEG